MRVNFDHTVITLVYLATVVLQRRIVDVALNVALTGALLSRDRLTEESCDREYTLEEIQRYITFAKQFKPKVRAKTLCVPMRTYR